jgi:hypothetical protein
MIPFLYHCTRVESTGVVLGILGLLGSYPANAGVFAKNMGRIKHNKGAKEYNIDAIKNTIVILVSQICRKLTQLINYDPNISNLVHHGTPCALRNQDTVFFLEQKNMLWTCH